MIQSFLFLVRALDKPLTSDSDVHFEAMHIREPISPLREATVASAQLKDNGAVSFFGLTLHPKSLPELVALVEEGVVGDKRWIISNHNLHSVYLFHRRPRLREFYANADWTFIDGMPLVALGRLYGYPLKREHRVTLADSLLPLMAVAAQRGWRVFNLGSPHEVAEKGAAELRRLYPGLQIEVSGGYFDARQGSAENEALLERINSYRPDLLMVGMSMPRQEYWTYENAARLEASVILSSNGAAIDYIAGAVPTPPRWAGRMGLEWAFRLVNEPRRLFRRYCVEPWYVLSLLMMDYLRTGGRLKAKAQRGG
ncbi:WecB/TagA/CpsF family glycosyltransferase [Granulicella sp. dw_53]|uniref:WecB/TagA/CpsF family glycosyltransferase n=1 Tax=Granulicella sp. dw_53 TaxID=2719792 RepID=UPI002107B57C|nr:WecB/TagA/CpsF family glycosyltransferase [Granulicella sp. dw_53]